MNNIKYNTIVLLRDSIGLFIHYEPNSIDDDLLDIYKNDIYKPKNWIYIKHWNNINSCVKLDESLGINHILYGEIRTNFTPKELTCTELREDGYFDLSNGAIPGTIRLKTDNIYNEKYYINLITKKIEDTPNLYD